MATEIATLGIEVRSNGVQQAARDLQRLDAAGGRAETAAAGLTRRFSAMGAALTGLGIAAVARQMLSAADEMTNIEARIRLVTSSSSELAQVQGELFRRSQEAQTSFRANAELYTGLARATDGLGVSQQRLIALTDGISKSMVVSGASAASSSGAIRQLGQALQSGVLRGDEFNSMAENAPRLMKALADGMGVARGALRGMAEEGRLTTDVVLPALEKGLKSVDAEFAQMPPTISRASTAISNAFDKLASDANAATGATSAIAGGMTLLANNLDVVANVIGVGVAAAIGKYVAAMGQAVVATVANVQAQRAALAVTAQAAVAETKRAAVNKASAVAELERARASVAATQLEIAADRERLASTALVIRAEIDQEKVRLAAQINDTGRAARLRVLADLSRQLAATETAAAAAGAKLTAVREAQVVATNAAAAATARLAATTAASTVATTAATRAAGLASGAMALLGGPIGIATTALIVGGAAWLSWRDKADTATADVENAVNKRINGMIDKLDALNGSLARTSRAAFEQTLAAGESELKTVRAEIKFLVNELDRLDTAGGRGRFSDEGKAKQDKLNTLAERQLDLEKQIGAARANAAKVGSDALDQYVSKFATSEQKLMQSRAEILQGFVAVIQKTSLDGAFDSANASHVAALRQYKAALAELDKKQVTRAPVAAARTPARIKEDINAGFDVSAAQSYGRAVESIARSGIDAARSTLDLNSAQSTLFDLMRSPEWERMPEPWRQVVIAQTAAQTETIRTAAEQRRLMDLISATPTAQLERQRETMQFLADAVDRAGRAARAFDQGTITIAEFNAEMAKGSITAEQFGEAASEALGNIAPAAKEATDIMEEFSKQAARNMQDVFADFLFDPFKDGLDGMLQNFGTMLQRMVAEAVAADLASRIMGPTGNGKGGWIDLAFTAASAYFGGGVSTGSGPANISRGGSFSPSFEGGGYTGKGSRVGGVDGRGGFPAVLHPNETVVDHSKGQKSSGQVINLTVNVASGTPSEVRRAAGAGAREALGAFSSAQRYA
jgi:tape measure domain-containing protein